MSRWRLAALVLAGTALGARASAHVAGLSRSTFDVAPDGAVHARLQWAVADLPAGARASEPALAELAVRGVDVRADGASCPGRFVASRPDGADGVALDLDFRCPTGAASIEAELFFLSDRGASSQDVATMTAGSRTAQGVLDGAHRTLRLELEAPKKSARLRLAAAIGASVLAAAVALFVAARRHRRR